MTSLTSLTGVEIRGRERDLFDEYHKFRKLCGYHSEENPGFIWEVWKNCKLEDQESMAQQMRDAFNSHRHPNRYLETHGDTW